jgi:hypothetical protein
MSSAQAIRLRTRLDLARQDLALAKAYHPDQPRDERGRWSASASVVVGRVGRAAGHAQLALQHVSAAAAADDSLTLGHHLLHASAAFGDLTEELRGLPADARWLGLETEHKLQQAKAALQRLKRQMMG